MRNRFPTDRPATDNGWNNGIAKLSVRLRVGDWHILTTLHKILKAHQSRCFHNC